MAEKASFLLLLLSTCLLVQTGVSYATNTFLSSPFAKRKQSIPLPWSSPILPFPLPKTPLSGVRSFPFPIPETPPLSGGLPFPFPFPFPFPRTPPSSGGSPFPFPFPFPFPGTPPLLGGNPFPLPGTPPLSGGHPFPFPIPGSPSPPGIVNQEAKACLAHLHNILRSSKRTSNSQELDVTHVLCQSIRVVSPKCWPTLFPSAPSLPPFLLASCGAPAPGPSNPSNLASI